MKMAKDVNDIELIVKECVANADKNGYSLDIDEMTADELATELMDVNDCFDEDDRELIVGIVLQLQEVRAGFQPGNKLTELSHYKRASEPQACMIKTAICDENGHCLICGVKAPANECRRSAQDIERDRQWNERAAKRRWEIELEEDQSGFGSFHGS